MSDLIPNSFQMPNIFVDELASLLDPEEFLVLSYLCRRTLGFQKRQDRVSLRQFTDGTRARDGRILDHGTGLGRSTVRDRLASLKQFGLIRETAPNNADNEGTEYSLELDLAKIDFAALTQRRHHEVEARRRRTEAARQARAADRAVPAPAPQAPPPPSVPQTPEPVCPADDPPSVTEPPGSLPDDPTPRPPDRPGACSGTDTQNPGKPRETQEGGWAHDPGTVDLYREMADPDEARRLLRDAGVAQTHLEYLTATPQRCYWSVFWATMWPSVAHRLPSATRFIRGRVEGACAGRPEDREEPSDWFPYAQRMKSEAARRIQADLVTRRDRRRFARPPMEFGPGAQPLWAAFRGAQRETDLAFLAGALRADLDDSSNLWITLDTETAVERLARRKTTHLEQARAVAPAFPDVHFIHIAAAAAARRQEVSHAA